MSEMQFSDNVHDMSTDSGFQFEFYCERCHDSWRSPFERSATGTMESMLGAADGFFGGIFGSARNALGQVRGAGWSSARDGAMRNAVAKAKDHFHRCPHCSNHFCENCWNADEGTCISCVPRLDAELATIRTEAKLSKAREKAYETAAVSDADLAARVVSCRECNAPVGRAKFCPDCGAPVSLTKECGSCGSEMPRASKFCPECGAKG